MKHFMTKSLIFSSVLGAVLMVLMAAKPGGRLTYPRRWIPMWEGKREAIMIHTDNIVTVEPIFTSGQRRLDKLKNSEALHLEIILADGRKLEIFEPFDEFMERIRRSQ